MGDGRGREREWRDNGEGMEMQEMGIHKKIAPKHNRFRICAPWGPLLVSYIFWKTIFRDIFIADTSSLYLEPFRVIELQL